MCEPKHLNPMGMDRCEVGETASICHAIPKTPSVFVLAVVCARLLQISLLAYCVDAAISLLVLALPHTML